MSYIIIDLETTGIPQYGRRRHSRFADPRNIEAYNRSRIVSMAWIILDERTLKPLHKRYFIIRPYDFYVHPASTAIHGISHSQAKSCGVSLLYCALPKLLRDIEIYNVHTIVAHNLDFDRSILLHEIYRLKLPSARPILQLKRLNCMCTMKMGQKRLGFNRFPSLTVLYERLTDEKRDPTEAHNALHDAAACARIFGHIISN